MRALYEQIAKDPRHTSCEVVSTVIVEKRTYDQWGMLQGDLKNWSRLASGQASLSKVIARRRGRYAREDMDDDEGRADKHTSGEGTMGKAEVNGEVHVGPEGPMIVPVAPA